MLAFSSQGQGKAIFYPLPLLLLSGANPVPSARNGFVPFFNLWEAVRQSYFLDEGHTYAAPCLPQMSWKLLHPCRWALPVVSCGGNGFALRWSVPGIRFLWWPWLWSKPVLTPSSLPNEEFEKQKEGSRTERMRPVMMVWSQRSTS